ncbi:glycosyl transferase [Litchfieldella qijiaojingensis]|uniref:Glycosyl transferase n=1 Tax=Litchfieldella qijiaojingensis TaxID=980347 RepID=A0ABQ2ZDV7_9GAMM|nr:glycosyltransferase [Halomonas qijiaojingensis]GGY10258.1 glycosyl transferase [Halomonas qijiaojingensis]
MSSKRFAFVISDLYGGGAEKSLLYTADGLRQHGNDVKVFILRDRIEQHIPEGLEVVNLAVITKTTKALNSVMVEKWQASRIAKALERFQPDVVLSCSCDKITRHLKHPNLYFWIKSDISARFRNSPKRDKVFARQRRQYNHRKVVAVSRGVERSLLDVVGLKPAEIRAIYNPYERAPFAELAKQDVDDIPQGEYFIHVGAFTSVKRHDRLLRAYKASGVTTPLLLLGKGAQEARIRSMIDELGLQDQVTLLGYRTNPYPYIQGAKALILTSDAEGLPRVLIEALMLHTPVVSVDCPSGPREILTQELADFLAEPENEKSLADAIKRMDQAPVEIEARHYEQFLAENVIPQFEAL